MLSKLSTICLTALLLFSCGAEPQQTSQPGNSNTGDSASKNANKNADCFWSATWSGKFNREVEGNVIWAGNQMGVQTGRIQLSQAQADRDTGDQRHNTALDIHLSRPLAVGGFDFAMGGQGGVMLYAPEAVNTPAQSGRITLTEASAEKVKGKFTATFNSAPHPTWSLDGTFSWVKGCPNK